MTQLMWSKSEIAEFDRLSRGQSSRVQLKRIQSRLDMGLFIKHHGKAKCDAMFAHLDAGGALEDGPAADKPEPHPQADGQGRRA